jgi:hypothetical protein
MLLLMMPAAARPCAADASRRDDERLSFQTHADWSRVLPSTPTSPWLTASMLAAARLRS